MLFCNSSRNGEHILGDLDLYLWGTSTFVMMRSILYWPKQVASLQWACLIICPSLQCLSPHIVLSQSCWWKTMRTKDPLRNNRTSRCVSDALYQKSLLCWSVGTMYCFVVKMDFIASRDIYLAMEQKWGMAGHFKIAKYVPSLGPKVFQRLTIHRPSICRQRQTMKISNAILYQ